MGHIMTTRPISIGIHSRVVPSTGVTAHIRKERGYKYIGSLLEQREWTYVDIATGEPISDFK